VSWDYDQVPLADSSVLKRPYTLSTFSSLTFIQDRMNASSWSRKRDENEFLLLFNFMRVYIPLTRKQEPIAIMCWERRIKQGG
jgi:hypothetical protein